MKVSDRGKKRQTGMLTASVGASSAGQLGRAIQALAEQNQEALVVSARQGFFEVRPVSAMRINSVSINSVRTKKALKVGRRLAKDALFSRATQLLHQDESSETTANIAQKFNATLENNKDFYDRLLLGLKR